MRLGHRDTRRQTERSSIAKMRDMHREVARLLVLGYKNNQIAKELDITTATVVNVKRAPIMKAYMESLHMDKEAVVRHHTKKMTKMLPACLETYEMALKGEDLGLRVKVADSILDRTGLPKTKEQHVVQKGSLLRSEDIQSVLQAAKELRNQEVIDLPTLTVLPEPS